MILERKKSYIEWLWVGDKNTNFFFTQKKNIIVLEDISKLFGDHKVLYYQTLFKTSNPSWKDIDILLPHMPQQVSNVSNQNLIQLVTLKKIRETTFSISHDKALEPDGMPSLFFNKLFSFVQGDVF